jgi:hypothetical protein
MIERSHIVTHNEAGVFYAHLGQAIDSMQADGLVVEVQYQQSDQVLSALLLGRRL